MKRTFIKDIKAGDAVDDVFALSEKSLAQKKDGKNYLNLSLADRTGVLKGVMWDQVDQLPPDLSSGSVVEIRGTVSEYRGALQLVVKSMAPVGPEGLDPGDFLPVTPRDMDQMFQRLMALSASIQSAPLKRLLEAFWSDEAFVKRFKTAPAAKKMHHPYVGGLLEHTLSTTVLADRLAAHYGVDRDLLLTGAMLHDIGKIRELETGLSFDYTDEGRLLSHIVIGAMMLREKIEGLKDFPEETAMLLEHMLISHHGSREFGSPEPPKTIEALLLNYVDEIDARVKSIREFMDSEDPSENWTSFHRTLERHFYMKNHKRKPEGPLSK